MSTFWIIFLSIYFSLNTFLSYYMYFKLKKFYDNKVVVEYKDKTPEIIDIHQKYHVFRKKDKLTWFRLFIGLNLFAWIKLILMISCNILLIISLWVLSLFGKENSQFAQSVIKFFVGVLRFFIGLRISFIRNNSEELYKSYFGDEYKFTYDEGYSLLISNHTGWVDIICYLNIYACGFISKEDVASYPLIGKVAKQVGCLFVKREDAENRNLILDQLKERQNKFLSDQNQNPLLIFPEGTTTSGKHILKLKKGAFYSLLPVKPVVINTTIYDNFHLSVGSAGVFTHLLRTVCYLYTNVQIIELPVMFPNETMYTRYQEKYPEITEKWEVYAEVAREIMTQACNMEKSDNTFRDSCEYGHIINGTKKKETLITNINNTNNVDDTMSKSKKNE